MADETKKYLVNIESNLKKYADEAAAAKLKVDELKAANEALKQSGQTSGPVWEQSVASLKNANQEYTKAQKMVQLQVSANSSETGSRKQLNEIMQLQMQDLGKLGNAYIINNKGVRELNPLYIEQRKRIAETKQAIIDYDLALNDGRSNIGRYSESIKGALSGLSAMPGPIGRGATIIQGFGRTLTDMSDGLSKAVTNMKGFGQKSSQVLNEFGQVAGNEMAGAATKVKGFAQDTQTGMNAAGTAATGFGATIKNLGRILLTTPIGWLITGITALIGIFTGLFKVWKSTAEGAGAIKDLFASLHAIVEVLRVRVVSLIDAFGHLFKGEFKKAGEDFKNTFQGIGESIAYVAGEAAKLSEAQRQLSKELAMHISEEATENSKIQEYLMLSKDKTKSDQERLDYLKMAMKLSEEKATKEVEYAQRQFNIDVGNAALKANIDQKSLAEWIAMDAQQQKIALEGSEKLRNAYNLLGGSDALKALEESQAKITNAQAEYYQTNKRTTSQISTLETELQSERKKRIEELIQLRELESKGDIIESKKALQYKFEQESKLIDQEIKLGTASNTQKLILKKQFDNEIKALDNEALAEWTKNQTKQKDALKANLDAQIKDIQYAAKIKITGLSTGDAVAVEKKAEDDILKLRTDYNDRIIQINQGVTARQKALLKSQYDEDIKNAGNNANQKAAIDRKYQKESLDIDQAAMIESQNLLMQEVNDYNLSLEQKKALDLKYSEWNKERLSIDADNRIELMTLQNQSEFEIRRAELELQHDQELQAAEKSGADILIINQKYAAARAQIDKAEYETKLMVIGEFAGSLAAVLGEQTALGKIAAVAQATINTYLAASKALATYPPPFGAIAMAGAIIAGLLNVKKIIEVKSGLPGENKGVSSASVSLPTAITSSAPAQRTISNPVGSTILTQPQLTQPQLNALPQQPMLTAQDIANAISKLPAPVVSVEDINNRTNQVKKVVVRANI